MCLRGGVAAALEDGTGTAQDAHRAVALQLHADREGGPFVVNCDTATACAAMMLSTVAAVGRVDGVKGGYDSATTAGLCRYQLMKADELRLLRGRLHSTICEVELTQWSEETTLSGGG